MVTRTILLIDDEKALLSGLCAIMKREGYRVMTASNGYQGLELAQKHRPDLIISDINMPSPNGFEVRQILAEDPSTKRIPFIFLTGRNSSIDKVRGLEDGADDYITKPFNRDELVARTKAVIRRVEWEREKAEKQVEKKLQELRHEALRNLGHELRTPINIVLGKLQYAIRKHFEYDPDKQTEFLNSLIYNTEQLESVVADLLMMNQLETGGLDALIPRARYQPLDLEHDFNTVIEMVQKRWQPVRPLTYHVTVDPETIVHAPSNGFKQAVRHLVDNACKFSSENGIIDISLAPNGRGGCILTVTDEGIGIPKELQEEVFTPFFQVSQGYSRRYGGLGIGLTIARAFARALGGDVTILDSENGCKVQMMIPPAHPRQ